MPAAFAVGELPLLAAAGDPRLDLAANAAEDRQVIQFLAGAPELMARYRNVFPALAAAALVGAAMDAPPPGHGGCAAAGASWKPASPGYLA